MSIVDKFNMVRNVELNGHTVVLVTNPIPNAMYIDMDTVSMIIMTTGLWDMGEEVRLAALYHELGHKYSNHTKVIIKEKKAALNHLNTIKENDSPLTVLRIVYKAMKMYQAANRRRTEWEVQADRYVVEHGHADGLRMILSSRLLRLLSGRQGRKEIDARLACI